MNEKNVLIVDDEKMIREAIAAYLTHMGWHVYEAENGRDALSIFGSVPFHFVILDLMLPEMSGEMVCEEIRKISNVPVIMLTAKTQEESVLQGFRLGADDYVTKPFSVKELYARMEAVTRRTGRHGNRKEETRDAETELSIDYSVQEVKKREQIIRLTKSEWKILSSMARHPKKVFTREELMGIVFENPGNSFDRVIDTHIKNLRKKLEDDPKNPSYIKTVHGMGYKFGGPS